MLISYKEKWEKLEKRMFLQFQEEKETTTLIYNSVTEIFEIGKVDMSF